MTRLLHRGIPLLRAILNEYHVSQKKLWKVSSFDFGKLLLFSLKQILETKVNYKI